MLFLSVICGHCGCYCVCVCIAICYCCYCFAREMNAYKITNWDLIFYNVDLFLSRRLNAFPVLKRYIQMYANKAPFPIVFIDGSFFLSFRIKPTEQSSKSTYGMCHKHVLTKNGNRITKTNTKPRRKTNVEIKIIRPEHFFEINRNTFANFKNIWVTKRFLWK